MTTKNLRIAIQKSGRLADKSQELFSQCGLKLNWKSSRLSVIAENAPVEVLRLRDDDIPGLVMEGLVDLGIVGENVLEESRLERKQLQLNTNVSVLRQLDFGSCRLCIAVPEDSNIRQVSELHNLRIATSYPQLLKQYLDQHQVSFKPCSLSGSVEVAPKSGLADAICDLVSSGATLEVNGLKNLIQIFASKACLIQQSEPLAAEKQTIVDRMMPRIQSILQARGSKYIMLHAPKQSLPAIVDLLPGAENPTLLPLAGQEDIIALHMVSSETLFWETMEQLKQLGASSILVLPIEKMMR